MKVFNGLLAGLSLVVLAACPASAVTLDLTGASSEGMINGALYQQVGPRGTGTGAINTFVQVQSNDDVEQAYNTTVNNVFDNGSSNVHNHELLLTDVPVVTIDGIVYRQFLLDINQTGSEPLLSLDEIQIFQSGTPNQSVESFSAGILNLSDSTLIYRLDLGGDNWIKLDASTVAPGSGQGDMLANVPDSFFTGPGQYVYLYSRFGENFVNNAGFEEWAPGTGVGRGDGPPGGVVPEPTTMLLFGAGLIGFARKKFRR